MRGSRPSPNASRRTWNNKVLYDTTAAVRASVREVVQTLFITFVLVVAVTFLFLADLALDPHPTLAIPVSLIGAYAALYALGFSANMITPVRDHPGHRGGGGRQHRGGGERAAHHGGDLGRGAGGNPAGDGGR